MSLLLVFVEVLKCLVVLTRDSRDNRRFFFFASNREREPDEILQNQSSPRGSDRPSIVRCRVVLIGSDGHSLLLTFGKNSDWFLILSWDISLLLTYIRKTYTIAIVSTCASAVDTKMLVTSSSMNKNAIALPRCARARVPPHYKFISRYFICWGEPCHWNGIACISTEEICFLV